MDEDKLFSLHSPWGGCQNLYPFAAFSTHTKREIREIKNGDATFMKKLSSVSLFSQFDLNFLGETDVFNGKDIVNVFPKWNLEQGTWSTGGTSVAKWTDCELQSATKFRDYELISKGSTMRSVWSKRYRAQSENLVEVIPVQKIFWGVQILF